MGLVNGCALLLCTPQLKSEFVCFGNLIKCQGVTVVSA